MQNHNHSLTYEAWQRLKQNKMAMYSFYILTFIIIICIIGSVIAFNNKNFNQTNLDIGARAPNYENIFGTDELGRGLFLRTLVGGCISLAAGLSATLVSLIIGVAYGAISAYIGGHIDNIMMRIVDILFSLPLIMFIMLITIITKQPVENFVNLINKTFLNINENFINILVLFALIGAINWLTMARIVRAQVSVIKNREFVLAARTIGITNFKIIFKHIIPNILGPVIVYSTLTVPAVMLTESTLSFLGLGVQAPLSSWGSLIKDGADKMDVYPWLIIFPAAVFSITLFALNFLGDGLRDALDPKSEKSQ